MKTRKKTLAIIIIISLILSLNMSVYASTTELSAFPEDIDPQSWVVPENMTWDDWKDNPVFDWETDKTVKARDNQKGLLILVDYKDKPFVLTHEKGSDPLGNPQFDAVKEKDLAKFWEDYLNVPSELNNFTSINGFWRENSYGKWDVDVDAYGPYHLEGMEWEYGLDGMNGVERDPVTRESARRQLRDESLSLALNSGDGIDLSKYNFAFIIHAGYDESGAWQEVGEMMFPNKESIPESFGPTAEEIASIKAAGEDGFDIKWFDENANWCKTRYVPWTSWMAAKSVWSHEDEYIAKEGDNSGLAPGTAFQLSIQGESDGMATFAHEFGHIRGIFDNYNNPYATPDGRSYTGSWELMSRGSFAGPVGTHTRWMIPSYQGSSSPAHHMTRLKLKQDFYDKDQYVRIKKSDLADGKIYATDVVAREIPIGDKFGVKGISSIIIDLEKDNTPIVTKKDADYNWQTSTWGKMENEKYKDKGYYQYYSLEVVDRVGYDSFASDAGVLLSMNREIENEVAPFMWIIDSHPDDIKLNDFKRTDGTEAKVSLGDARQLADALFHAGTGDSVINEYADEHNNLQFYVLDKKYDDKKVLSYRVAVRSTESVDNYKRGVKVSESENTPTSLGKIAVQNFDVTNTGDATDIIRLAVSSKNGSKIKLQNNLIEVEAGKTVKVPVYVQIPQNASSDVLTFVATSETDKEQSVTTLTEVVANTKITDNEIKDNAKSFTDVENHWAKDYINFAVSRGLFDGVGSGQFAPDQTMTRGMIVTVLGKLSNVDVTKHSEKSSFTDVEQSKYYAPYISWASANGIVSGVGDGQFAPDAPITREQMAVIISKYAKFVNYTLSTENETVEFGDSNKISEWSKNEIKEMQKSRIMSGIGQNNFSPQGESTRAQVAMMLQKLISMNESK